MNSSGIKRGLATTAVAALAVTGLPFLASSASATTVASTLPTADSVELYSPSATAFVSTKNDGTNATVSLTAGGGANVTSVLFQYQAVSTGATWNDVPGGLVARNADGVFTVDWANPPADLSAVRAVGSTNATDDQTVTRAAADSATTNTVELGTEGALGVFVSPYTEATEPAGQYIGVRGTTSGATTPVTISQVSHEGQTATDSVTTTSADADGTGAGTTGAFSAIMDITGYVASSGSDANQLVLGAATTGAGQNTDDAEGSTLRNQTITTVTATPEAQDAPAAGGKVTVKVTDQFGQPVANAQVGTYRADGADADTLPDDAGTVVGYTNANGEIEVTQTFNGAVTYYANTTDANAYNAGTDPSDAATVNVYTPSVGSVVIKSRGDRAAFDLDELLDGDEFTIETRDQKGNLFNEDNNATNDDSPSEVEYRWVIDPAAAGAPTLTQAWQTNAVDNGNTFTVPALTDTDYNDATQFAGTPGGDLPVGTYTLEARRPNVGLGGGLVNATPAAFTMGESEVTFTEGTDATATAGGSTTVDGKLALTGTDGAGLAGRAVPLTYAPGVGGNAGFAPQSQQPAGVTVTSATTATVVTGANGTFSVKLNDVPFPANVTPTGETGTLTAGPATEAAADGTSLAGTNGPGGADAAGSDATGSLTVNWRNAPAVGRIAVTANTLDPRNAAANTSTAQPGPGVPVDLDIVVYAKDNDTNPANDVAIKDFPVAVSVDKGFLSPNAETANDAVLTDEQDDQGDLWGFFKNEGASKTVSTGDSNVAGAVVAIEKDAGFDDDGVVNATVTVKAGDVTTTQDITFDSRVLVNAKDANLERADGEAAGDVEVGEEVGFHLTVHDQFGNLVGDQLARISDDSTVADFDTDESFDQTLTDFTTSGVGIVAFSDGETTQTLTALMNPGQVLVNAAGDPAASSKSVSVSSDPINWVAEQGPKEPINLRLSDSSLTKKRDRISVNAEDNAAGVVATLFKNGQRVKSHELNEAGDWTFSVKDTNGDKKTRYKVVVAGTETTMRAVRTIKVN